MAVSVITQYCRIDLFRHKQDASLVIHSSVVYDVCRFSHSNKMHSYKMHYA